MLSEWISVDDSLPDSETPVLVCFQDGTREVAELVWDIPGFEDTYKEYQYWDSPSDDGKDWQWDDITHWTTLPEPILYGGPAIPRA
jgi:hypothetical protein